MTLDLHLFQIINNFADVLSFFNPIIRFFAQDVEYVFYLGIIVYWFWRTPKNRRMAGEALIAAAIGLAVSSVLSHFFYRDRPFVVMDVIQLIPHAANASFPSDHAIAAFAIAAAIWINGRKEGWLWGVLAGCIAFSRIWAGVHYPSDVVAGMLIGAASAVIVHYLLAYWKMAGDAMDSVIRLYEIVEYRIWPQKEKRDPNV